jgi:hypothetical protein
MLQRLLTAAKCDDVVKKPPQNQGNNANAATDFKVTAAMMRELVPSRDKLITLCDVLDLQLAELKSLHQSGALRAFTGVELCTRVKALFEHSEAREQVCVCVCVFVCVYVCGLLVCFLNIVRHVSRYVCACVCVCVCMWLVSALFEHSEARKLVYVCVCVTVCVYVLVQHTYI